MSLSQVRLEGKWKWDKITRCLNPRWQWLPSWQFKSWVRMKNSIWLKPSWENSRWLSSSSWVRMNEFESDWISLNQSQSGGECFWVNLREENKVSEFHKMNPRWQNSKWQNSRWPPSSSWVRMNEWSFLVQMLGREVSVKFFCANGGNQSWQVWVCLRGKNKIKMVAIIQFSCAVKFFFVQMVGTNLGKYEWVWEKN